MKLVRRVIYAVILVAVVPLTANIGSVLEAKNPFLVVLDPGHGGIDSGAISADGVSEKNITLNIARFVGTILEEYGIQTVMTRYDDEYISLKSRAAYINANNPDMCLSIHANASPLTDAEGFESYLYQRDIVSSQWGNVLCRVNDINPLMMNSLAAQTKMMKKVQLAYFLHKQLRLYTSAYDRGIRAGNYYVLRKTTPPAVLFEAGFLSNPSEARKLGTTAYQQIVARGLAEGIVMTMFGNHAKLDTPDFAPLAPQARRRRDKSTPFN